MPISSINKRTGNRQIASITSPDMVPKVGHLSLAGVANALHLAATCLRNSFFQPPHPPVHLILYRSKGRVGLARTLAIARRQSRGADRSRTVASLLRTAPVQAPPSSPQKKRNLSTKVNCVFCALLALKD